MANPREPKHVKKLIETARKNKVEAAVVRYTKRIVEEITNRRNGHGGGTRGEQR